MVTVSVCEKFSSPITTDLNGVMLVASVVVCPPLAPVIEGGQAMAVAMTEVMLLEVDALAVSVS